MLFFKKFKRLFSLKSNDQLCRQLKNNTLLMSNAKRNSNHLLYFTNDRIKYSNICNNTIVKHSIIDAKLYPDVVVNGNKYIYYTIEHGLYAFPDNTETNFYKFFKKRLCFSDILTCSTNIRIYYDYNESYSKHEDDLSPDEKNAVALLYKNKSFYWGSILD